MTEVRNRKPAKTDSGSQSGSPAKAQTPQQQQQQQHQQHQQQQAEKLTEKPNAESQQQTAAATAAAATAEVDADDKTIKASQQRRSAEDKEQLVSKVVLVVLTAAAVLTRTWMLHHPGEVVFDEVHFGKFASYYLRGEYFFDVHPPLGKMLLAGVGYLVGYDGHFLFDNIGDDYAKNNVPYVAFRLYCALCGAAVIPLSYMTLREIGLSIAGASLGALLLILDNALITQSRLILLDSMLMLFCTMCIYFWVRFYKQRHNAFSAAWWGWLTMTGVGIALVFGVKMVGLFTMGTIGIATLFDLWELLDIKRGLSLRQFSRHFAARFLCLLVLPAALYLLPFYIHFKILSKTGTGDSFMSPKFQEGLIGNSLSIGSVSIMYEANITIKHQETNHYLHSHEHKYPLRYEDDRISSQGQQVNAYAHSDSNSLWRILPVRSEFHPLGHAYEPTAEETERGVRYVRNNDLVHISHVATSSFLLTHDVASPMTSTHMEMTTVSIAAAGDRYNETIWRIEIDDGIHAEKLKSKKMAFRIINFHHNVALHTNPGPLPDWGFKMQQTNGNKKLDDSANLWRVEEVNHWRVVNGTEIGEEAPKPKSSLSFLQKFLELQKTMLRQNAALTASHPYSSSPGSWPFVLRGISFWEKKEGWKQIYLLGNPIVWWFSIGSVFIYLGLTLVDRLCLRRGIDDFGINLRRWWDRAIGFLIIAWACHWLPFFLMGRQLFLHHYFPAFIFSTMIAAALFDFVSRAVFSTARAPMKTPQSFKIWFNATPGILYLLVWTAILSACGWSFWYFSMYSYGTGHPTIEHLRAHKWLKSWDLQYS